MNYLRKDGANLKPVRERPSQVPRKRTVRKSRASAKGRLIVFEGVDGTGKTTLVEKLRLALENQGLRCATASFPGQRPGTLGAHIYLLYHDPLRFDVRSFNASALQLLETAAHIEVIESVVLPSLRLGHVVILDRYWWSTWVYGKAAGVSSHVLSKLIELERISWAIVLLMTRSNGLPGSHHNFTKQQRLAQLYRSLARREAKPDTYPVHTISNNGPIQTTVDKLLKLLKPEKFPSCVFLKK